MAYILALLAPFPVVMASLLPPIPMALLVVYTPAASGGAGGAAAIQSQVRQAVVEANSVLQNSLVNARIRLVGLSEIAYQESGSVAKDLDRLRGTNDGFMDEVHALRVQLGADLVCLVTETGDDLWFYGLQGPLPSVPSVGLRWR